MQLSFHPQLQVVKISQKYLKFSIKPDLPLLVYKCMQLPFHPQPQVVKISQILNRTNAKQSTHQRRRAQAFSFHGIG